MSKINRKKAKFSLLLTVGILSFLAIGVAIPPILLISFFLFMLGILFSIIYLVLSVFEIKDYD